MYVLRKYQNCKNISLNLHVTETEPSKPKIQKRKKQQKLNKPYFSINWLVYIVSHVQLIKPD